MTAAIGIPPLLTSCLAIVMDDFSRIVRDIDAPADVDTSIEQLLSTLGMTREDLERRSVQMRQFLTAENVNSFRAMAQKQTEELSKPSSAPLGHKPVNSAPQQRYPNIYSNADASTSSRSSSQDPFSQSSTATTKSRPSLHDAASHSHSLQRHATHKSGHAQTGNRGDGYKQRDGLRGGGLRSGEPSSSPTKVKPSLDAVMSMRSRVSRRPPLPEESEDSESDEILVPHPPLSAPISIPQRSPYYREDQYQSPDPLSSPSKCATPHASGSGLPESGSSSSYYRHPYAVKEEPTTPSARSRHPSQDMRASSSDDLLRSGSSGHYRMNNAYEKTSIPPPSSPIPFTLSSSPVRFLSSPVKMDINVVDEVEPPLPFVLPPGPFDTEKPELSYAALIGRAILASPNHMLRLKDIYDYISTVFPYFQRSGGSHSQKWMNAIRQNLTNTPQFHKVIVPTDDDGVRGAFWHIRDGDLICFIGGSYKRTVTTGPSTSGDAAKPAGRFDKRKRKLAEDPSRPLLKKLKTRQELEETSVNPYHFPYTSGESLLLPALASSRGTTSSNSPPQNSDAGLSQASSLHRGLSTSQDSGSSISSSAEQTELPRRLSVAPSLSRVRSNSSSTSNYSSATPPPSSSASSCSGLPDLTPNYGSSSSPPPEDVEDSGQSTDPAITIENGSSTDALDALETNEEGHALAAMFKPSSKDKASSQDGRGSHPLLLRTLPAVPTTPTNHRKSKGIADNANLLNKFSLCPLPSNGRMEGAKTPPRPSTPENDSSLVHPTSSLRTPISNKNNRSRLPSTQDDGEDSTSRASLRPYPFTFSLPNLPSTPKKFSSPFPSTSPFKTPGRSGWIDAHDPGSMLDEELSRLGSTDNPDGLQESPFGIFPRNKGMLYESPNIQSPGNWRRPW